MLNCLFQPCDEGAIVEMVCYANSDILQVSFVIFRAFLLFPCERGVLTFGLRELISFVLSVAPGMHNTQSASQMWPAEAFSSAHKARHFCKFTCFGLREIWIWHPCIRPWRSQFIPTAIFIFKRSKKSIQTSKVKRLKKIPVVDTNLSSRNLSSFTNR